MYNLAAAFQGVNLGNQQPPASGGFPAASTQNVMALAAAANALAAAAVSSGGHHPHMAASQGLNSAPGNCNALLGLATTNGLLGPHPGSGSHQHGLGLGSSPMLFNNQQV